MCERSFASRWAIGSSNRNTFGSRTIARPIAVRCFWPPLSSTGLRLSRSPISSISAAQRTRFSISSLGIFRSLSGLAMFSKTVLWG